MTDDAVTSSWDGDSTVSPSKLNLTSSAKLGVSQADDDPDHVNISGNPLKAKNHM